MAPTNSGIVNGEITSRFDLGGHKNFMESSKALIQSTNTRLERIKTISNELRYLADQIKDDRDVKNPFPDITLCRKINNIKDALDKKPKLKVVIPADENKVTKSTRAKKTKKTLKSNSNHSDKSTDKKRPELLTGMNIDISKNETLYTDHKQATCTSMANTGSKKIRHEDEKLPDNENDYNPVRNIESDDDLMLQRHCCLFRKLKVCRGMEHGELKQQWYNGLDHRKILEKLRKKKLTRSTPTPLKTSMVDLSLPRRLHSQCCTRENYQLGNNMYCSLNEKQKCQTAYFKINKSTELGQKGQIQRNVLLPKKITLQDNGTSDTLCTESIQTFDSPVGFRFRLCKSSKELLTNTDISHQKIGHSYSDSHFIFRPL